MSPKCLIVGAGLSGIIAARKLRKKGWEVTLLEKAKSLGGRMATRQIGEAVFDFGAQQFAVHSMFFRLLVEQMQDDGLVESWSRGFLNGDRQMTLDGYLRFYGTGGMNSIAQHLAADLSPPLDIRLQETVKTLECQNSSWRVSCDSGLSLEADALILTPPLPQSLQLLKKAQGFEIDPDQLERFAELKYEPCIAVMAVLDGPSGLPEPGGLANTDPMTPVMWIADNQQKGISPVPAVTILGTAYFSRQHWKTPREEAGQKLWAAAQPYFKAGLVEMQTHGWRFAEPKSHFAENYVCLQTQPPLFLAGDAFGETRNPLEGAAISGLDAAKALLKL